MKTNYWSPHRSSSAVLVVIAILAVGGLAGVEHLQFESSRPFLQEKLAAANLARQAMDRIKTAHLERGLTIDPATDLSESGLIGQSMSSITSNNGSLPAKQTTVNPNFAAVIVDMLKEAGVEEGDAVAVGFSGSFPAINLCVLSAVETLNVQPIVISSITASQWGANVPEFPWIEMEQELVEAGLIRRGSVAASLGGVEDMGIGVPPDGQEALRTAIARRKLTFIEPANYLDSVNQRMDIYHQRASGAPIKAYINVGGGTVSVGTKKGKNLFEPGLNRHKPLGRLPADSVMARFLAEDVPVIHLSHIDDLAMRYGLPMQPAVIPRVGEGDVYAPRTYNKPLAGGLLALIVGSVVALARAQSSIGKIATDSVAARRRPVVSEERELEPLPL